MSPLPDNMRNLSDKILPPLCSSLYAHHDKKHLLQHFTTKNPVADQFNQKTPQISKKTDSKNTVFHLGCRMKNSAIQELDLNNKISPYFFIVSLVFNTETGNYQSSMPYLFSSASSANSSSSSSFSIARSLSLYVLKLIFFI